MKDQYKTIVIAVTIVVLLVAVSMVLAMQTPKEKRLSPKEEIPFEIIDLVVSSSGGGDPKEENKAEYWDLELYQNNNIYVTVKPRESSVIGKSKIKRLYVDGISVIQAPQKGISEFYRPSENTNVDFEYKEDYKIEDTFEYEVISVTDETTPLAANQIGNDGGIIKISHLNRYITEYITMPEVTQINLTNDATLLKKADITIQDIICEIAFDIHIINEIGEHYKSTIQVKVPQGNILEDGFNVTVDQDITSCRFTKVENENIVE